MAEEEGLLSLRQERISQLKKERIEEDCYRLKRPAEP